MRGHATSRSPCMDGIVLSVTNKNNFPVKHVKIVYGKIKNVQREVFLGDGSNEDNCY